MPLSMQIENRKLPKNEKQKEKPLFGTRQRRLAFRANVQAASRQKQSQSAETPAQNRDRGDQRLDSAT